MKILFTISSTTMGGAEKQLLYLIAEAKKTHECSLIVLAPYGSMSPQYENLGIPLLEVSRSSLIGLIRQVIVLRQFLIENEIHVVQSFLYESDILVSLASLGLSTKVFWTAGNVNVPNFNFFKRKLLATFSRFFPVGIFPNSKQASDFHISIGYPSKKMHIVDNFLPAVIPLRKTVSAGINQKRVFKVGMAARPVFGKGHLTLIKAAELAFSENLEIDIEFIGDGVDSWEYLLSEKTKSTIEKHITLLPKRPNLESWYESLDCYVMASEEWESFPNTLTEAILAECPVISSDIADIAYSKFGVTDTFQAGNILELSLLLNSKAKEVDLHRQSEVARLKNLLLEKYSNEQTYLTWENAWTHG